MPRPRRRLGAWVLAAAAVLTLGSPDLRAAALAQLDRAAELAGLGLQQVALAGHRFTADADIYDALELDSVRSLLAFDVHAAKARVERLPWIEHASIERVPPDQIEVRVTERVPFAVWRTTEGSWLVDRTGRKLQIAPPDVLPRLLRVSGAGAAQEAAGLAAVLVDFPQIARRIDSAERVGGRRWRLHLADGGSVDLPAADEADALARLARLHESGLGGARRVDLRVSGRILVGAPDRASTAERRPAIPGART